MTRNWRNYHDTLQVDRERLRKAIKVALINQLLINLPGSILAMRLKHRLGVSCRPEDLPRALTVLRDLAVFAIVEEIGFYYTHRQGFVLARIIH